MDRELQIAQISNLILKTKIVIVFFIAVIVLQIVGISYLSSDGSLDGVPFIQLLAVPLFIGFVIVSEFFILKFLKKGLQGEKKFGVRWKYFITVLEILYPTLVLYYGSVMFLEVNFNFTPFMFLNSPPFIIYFIFIILSCFYFDFRVSVFTGFLAMLGYVIVNYMVMETGSMEFGVNISKAPFLLACGVLAGFVGKKMRISVVSSLEAKNTLIHELDKKVAERTVKIEKQKEELADQFDLLQERNEEITDSIVYAKRIQNAILPPDKLIKEHLPQSFILYKPKDIVAGDFYWLEPTKEGILFAAADCTGHGVPGALVSVVCNNGLNRAVREYGLVDPGKVLDKTRDIVLEEFEKSEEGVSDGMDIAVCSLAGNKLTYAGAHNPLWIIRKDAVEIEEIKADKQPIGKFDHPKPYQTHQVDLKAGDTFYIFSDGFADQFGGEKGKKFKAANFKRLLLSIQSESIENQKAVIDKAFEDWRGSLEQLDDVCVIGVRV